MRTPKRRAAAVAAATACLLALSACGTPTNDQGASSPAGQTASGPVQLTFWSWVPGVDKAVDLWNSKNPDIQVKLDRVSTGSSGTYAKVYSALKAGDGIPDLIQLEYSEIPAMLAVNGLTNLNDYGFAADKAKFVDWQWNMTQFGDGVYAVPQASGPEAFFYRSDVFEKLGLDAPKTWADFAAAAKAIHEADPNQYISTMPPSNAMWFAGLAWQAGASWYKADGDSWQVDIDSKESLRVADYWQKLIDDGVVKTDPDFANGWYKDLQDGNIVGWVSAQWGDAILQENAPDTAGKWAVAPMPQWEGRDFSAGNYGGSTTALPAGTAHPAEALKFATWLNTDPEAIDLLIAGGYGWPAAAGAFEGSALDKAYPFFGDQKINDVFEQADAAVNKNWQWSPNTSISFQALQDGLQKAVEGKGTVADALRDAQAKTVADLKAKGFTVIEN